MNLEPIAKVTKTVGTAISKNSPTILTGIAVGGLFTTVIFAVRATPKAMAIIEEHTEVTLEGSVESPSKKEIIKLTWKLYIPAACMGALTVACIIASNSINHQRNAALATAYGLSEVAFREYKDKVVETVGKNKELKIRDEIASDQLKADPPTSDNVIITGHGNVLCRDAMSGRYFRSDIAYVKNAFNSLNHDLAKETWLSLNDLYYLFDLKEIALGEQFGWDSDRGLVEPTYTSDLTETGEPCLVIKYDAQPKFYK